VSGRPVRRRDAERGFALFLALLVLLVVTVGGIALMLMTSVDLTLSGNETKVSKIFYAADSGIEYGAAKLRSDVNYKGGPLPVGLSSNYLSTSPDIQVAVTQPIVVGYTIHPGDAIEAQGSAYGTSQVVENFFTMSSTATSTSIQANKSITADVGIYPQLLTVNQ